LLVPLITRDINAERRENIREGRAEKEWPAYRAEGRRSGKPLFRIKVVPRERGWDHRKEYLTRSFTVTLAR